MTADEGWLQQTFGLSGKVAVVTGGTRGIGSMVAEGLLRAGATVLVCSRDEAACREAEQSLRAFGDVTAVPANLASEAGCVAFAREVAARHDSVDILVNNAGAAWGAPIDEYPEEGWDKVMDLNVKAIFMLTRHLLPQLERGATPDATARVVNIGSIDGLVVPAMPNFAYSASKAAVHHLTRVLANSLGSRNIQVNAIAPGPFESKMTAFMFDKLGDQVVVGSPLGRAGRPLDMAAAAVYLASAASGYVTGAVLPVDGGIATTAGSSPAHPGA